MLGGIVNFFLNRVQERKYQAYLRLFETPAKAQEESLLTILSRCSNTKIVKQLGIENVSTLAEFQKSCPITSYEDYQELITELYQTKNEPGVLSNQAVEYFVETSGTTSKPKYIPITDQYREECQRSFLPWIGCIKHIRPETFQGKTLFLADVRILSVSPTGVPCGVFSGYNFRKIPAFMRKKLYCTHENFYELGDPKKRDIALLAHSISADLTNLACIIPESIRNFADKFFLYAQEVISYMESGVPPFEYPSAYKKSLLFKPKPQAVERAKIIAKKGKIDQITELYPNLKTIICWKGATAKFYLDRMQNYIPDHVVVWDAMYSASEGWFNFPNDPSLIGGPVSVSGHFIEFRLSDQEDASLLMAHELEEGNMYEVFVTSSSGLFRYRMKDLVKVTGFFKNTPRIAFVEKAGHFLDSVMERITPNHVQELVERIITICSLDRERIPYFTMSPCHKQELLHYTLIIETDYSISTFESIDIEKLFYDINPNYKRCVEDGLLGVMHLAIIKQGYIKEELARREREQKSIAQFKYSPIEKDGSLTRQVCPCTNI